MIERHAEYTQQRARREDARRLGADACRKFVKVMPKDYKRVLQAHRTRRKSQGLSGDEAIMAAFEENARDVARVGGG